MARIKQEFECANCKKEFEVVVGAVETCGGGFHRVKCPECGKMQGEEWLLGEVVGGPWRIGEIHTRV